MIAVLKKNGIRMVENEDLILKSRKMDLCPCVCRNRNNSGWTGFIFENDELWMESHVDLERLVGWITSNKSMQLYLDQDCNGDYQGWL